MSPHLQFLGELVRSAPCVRLAMVGIAHQCHMRLEGRGLVLCRQPVDLSLPKQGSFPCAAARDF